MVPIRSGPKAISAWGNSVFRALSFGKALRAETARSPCSELRTNPVHPVNPVWNFSAPYPSKVYRRRLVSTRLTATFFPDGARCFACACPALVIKRDCS